MSAIFLSHSSADKDAAASLHDWLLRLGDASVLLIVLQRARKRAPNLTPSA
jgi:hypothetical protein